jgi:DNA sulfur modification protein DndE
MAQLNPGDWVVIQYGHNDEKSQDPERYADPDVAFPENLRRLVSEVRARGANVVLATPVARRHWAADGTLTDTHGAYVGAVKTVAASEGVPLLDLEQITRETITGLGPDRSKELFVMLEPGAHPSAPNGVTDNTHFSEAGARLVAGAAAAELLRLGAPFVSQ